MGQGRLNYDLGVNLLKDDAELEAANLDRRTADSARACNLEPASGRGDSRAPGWPDPKSGLENPSGPSYYAGSLVGRKRSAFPLFEGGLP